MFLYFQVTMCCVFLLNVLVLSPKSVCAQLQLNGKCELAGAYLPVCKKVCAYNLLPQVLFFKPLTLILERKKNTTNSINSLPSRKFYNPFFSKCQTDWIQIRPDIMLGMICVQSVCKGY